MRSDLLKLTGIITQYKFQHYITYLPHHPPPHTMFVCPTPCVVHHDFYPDLRYLLLSVESLSPTRFSSSMTDSCDKNLIVFWTSSRVPSNCMRNSKFVEDEDLALLVSTWRSVVCHVYINIRVSFN